MYRVVQWATGSMGRTSLRRIIDHPDLELAGVYVYDPRKAGRDAGELVKRAETGIRATDRIEDILALQPDVVIHTPRLTDPYAAQNDPVIRLLGAGINVISTAGFQPTSSSICTSYSSSSASSSVGATRASHSSCPVVMPEASQV